MKFNPSLFSAILAINVADAKPNSDPIKEGEKVLGALPTILIQFWSYMDNLIDEANAELNLLSNQLEQLCKRHEEDHLKGIPSDECCSTFGSKKKILLDNVKKIHSSAQGYTDFFWHLVHEHFELNKEECGNIAIRENWQVVQTPPSPSFVESLLQSLVSEFKSGFDDEEPGAEKTPGGENPDFAGALFGSVLRSKRRRR